MFDIFKKIFKKSEKTSCHDLLDSKMVAHILGGSWAKIADLEGNDSLAVLKYFETYLSEYTDSSTSTKKSIFTAVFNLINNVFDNVIAPTFNLFKSIILHKNITTVLKQPIKKQPEKFKLNLNLENLDNLKNLAIKINKEIISVHNQSLEEQTKQITEQIRMAINDFRIHNDGILIIPGGWSALPADPLHGHSKHPGHEMYYFIKPDPKHLDRFIFGVINSGSGIETYHYKKFTRNEKNIYSPTIEWNNLTIKQAVNHKMLEELLKARILPVRYSLLKQSKDDQRPLYNEKYIYNTLYKYLPKTNIVKNTNDYITPQRIGNCSWKALMMVMRKLLGKNQYKKFIVDLKLNTLKILHNNLLNNPSKYKKHHFIMIKALRYGAQKIAKTLEKRKIIFSQEELIRKTNLTENLFLQAKLLQQNYLTEHPGILTNQTLPFSLNKLRSNPHTSEFIAKTMRQTINDKMSLLITTPILQHKIKQQQILIPKLKYSVTEPVKNFLNSLQECAKYAYKLKNNHNILRAFLTHNVFNCLPIGSDFFDRFNSNTEENSTQMLDFLKTLKELILLYGTTINANGIPLPEHRYNYAKIFSIGKTLTKKYAANSNNFKNIIKDDTFALPVNFAESFSRSSLALDPYSSKQWELLKATMAFKFRKLLYEQNLIKPITQTTLLSYPEFRLYPQLLNCGTTVLVDHEETIINSVLALIEHKNNIPQTFEQQQLTSFVEIMQSLSIGNTYIANSSKPSDFLNFRILKFKYLNINYFLIKLDKTIEQLAPQKNLFNQQLPYPYFISLNNNPTQNNLLLDRNKATLSTEEIYNVQLIVNAPNIQNTQPTQLTLLLNYFEKLPEHKQKNSNLLEFFKQIFLSNIDNLMEQLQQHPLLINRLSDFFNQEFNNISNNFFKLKDFQGNINKYLCFQRIIHKIYSYLKEYQQQLDQNQLELYAELNKILSNTRKTLLDWLEYSNVKFNHFDNGQIAAYGLASFGHIQAPTEQLSEQDLKTAIIFSIQAGIYGLGKNNEQYDLLLTKDLYDVRLKIAESVQHCNPALKQILLNLCLDIGLQHNNIKTINFNNNYWQESDPYYFIYANDNNGNEDLIQINLIEGIILINGIQLTVDTVPEHILNSAPYKKIFGEAVIDVIKQENYLIPQKKSLSNLIIKENLAAPNTPEIFWSPLHNSKQDKYILLQKLDGLKLPPLIANSDFTYWAKVTNNPDQYKILITSSKHDQEPLIYFEILSNGKIVTTLNSNTNNLSLSHYNSNNIFNILKFAENLGCKPENILTWENDIGIITKIDIPLADEQGNWLSFTKKTNNDNVIRWYWDLDPNYYISSRQILYGKPSISNFILLQNIAGKQKVLFAYMKESDRIALPQTDQKLNLTYPPNGKLKIKYIAVEVKQSSNFPETPAKFIESFELGSISNLYVVYLMLMHPENEPSDASILLNKQRPLRRYTTEELEILWWIINSNEEQITLNKESLHPDAIVTRLLAIYLIKSNLEKYPFSKQKKDNFNLFDENNLLKFAKHNYQSMLNLPNTSERGRLSNFISSSDLKVLQLADKQIAVSDKVKFKKLPPPKYLNGLSKNIEITNEELSSLQTQKQLLSQLLSKTKQKICEDINNLLKLPATEQSRQLNRMRIYSGNYELNIDNAIYLYLKQNVNLWTKHTGLTDIHSIHNIQDQIIKYLLLNIKINKIQKLLTIKQQINLLEPNSDNYLIKYKNLNTQQHIIVNAKLAYNPIQHPAFLVFEVSTGIILRQEQVDTFKRLLNDNGAHQEQQLEIMMGAGKSKVISPLLSYAKADGKHLSILVLTDPLYNSGSLDLQKSLGLLGARTETIEYSRQTNSLSKVIQLQNQINQAIKEGITCTSRIRDLQTIAAMPEVLLEEIYQSKDITIQDEKIKTIKILLDINNTIKTKGLFTLDELDTQLYSKHQLNLPVGVEKTIPTIGINVSTELFLMLLTENFNDIPVKDWLLNNHQTFLSSKDFEKQIKPILVKRIFDKHKKNLFKLTNTLNILARKKLKMGFMAYLGVGSLDQPAQKEASQEFYKKLQNLYKLGGDNYDVKILIETIVMYKIQLFDGKLQEALSKCSNVNFGPSKLTSDLEIAIPYASSNQPKEFSSTECAFFKDPWETINKTYLYYISSKWQSIEQTKNFVMFLLNNFNLKNNHMLINIFGTEVITLLKLQKPHNLQNVWLLTLIKDKIEQQRLTGNTDLLTLIFKYLNESIFPEQIKYYPVQINSTPYDFAAQPKKLNGYSGTRQGENTWPDRLQRDTLHNIDQKIHDRLLDQSDTNFNRCFSDVNIDNPNDLIKYLLKKSSLINLTKYSSFIDAGALFKEFSNREIAEALLNNLPTTIQAVIFYYEVSPGVTKLALIKRNVLNIDSTPIIIEGSSPEQIAIALNCSIKQLETTLFNFYDQAHIIGADLPNPPTGRALITFSEQLSKDLMNQAIMRMRKFMKSNGQHVDFLVPENIKNVILKNLNLPETELTLEHLVKHAKLIQEGQEQQDYYDSLHKKLQHEIKNYLITKIRNLLSDNKLEAALELYKKTREFLLYLEEENLFKKYGAITEQIDPISILTNKVNFLKSKLNKLKIDLDNFDHIKINFNRLKAKLDQIINIDPRMLPEKISSNTLTAEEMEVSREQQAELQLEEQEAQEDHQNNQYLTPAINSLVLGNPKPKTSCLEYLQTFNFNQTKSFKTILSQKIALETNLNIQKRWHAFNTIIDDNIYYTSDALKVFNEIDPTEGILTKYEKPIHQVLIIEEQINNKPELKLIVLSAQESANFALSIANARFVAKISNKDPVLDNRKIWLVSPNGEALDGTDKWTNPFNSENISTQTLPFSKLLLQILILQQNAKFLADLLNYQSSQLRTTVVDWFNNHKLNIELIFNKEKFKQLIKKPQLLYKYNKHNEHNKMLFTRKFLQTDLDLKIPLQPMPHQGLQAGK